MPHYAIRARRDRHVPAIVLNPDGCLKERVGCQGEHDGTEPMACSSTPRYTHWEASDDQPKRASRPATTKQPTIAGKMMAMTSLSNGFVPSDFFKRGLNRPGFFHRIITRLLQK